MTTTEKATHVLCNQYPELMTDDVSQYVNFLKGKLGPSKASAVYAQACRAAPVGDNPMGLRRGSVVEIEGERYLTLGSGFMNLEFANLGRPGVARTIGPDEFVRLSGQQFRVLDEAESKSVLGEVMSA
ncbi:MAG: hypothetical protein P8106_02690 [Gammaproteobacteria bacterium]|jgi:hypothetical protein